MAQNKPTDVMNMIVAQMESLANLTAGAKEDEPVTTETKNKAILMVQQAKAMEGLASQYVNIGRLQLDAAQMALKCQSVKIHPAGIGNLLESDV